MKITIAIFAAAALYFTNARGAEVYIGYFDDTYSASGYEAAECSIDYLPTAPPSGESISAWVGIDNDNCSDWMFLQAGWLQLQGQNYGWWFIEWITENGNHQPPILLGVPNESTSSYWSMIAAELTHPRRQG